MDPQIPKPRIIFFPYLIKSHLTPMIDIARVLTSHGVDSTIVTTPENAVLYHKTIERDQQLGHDINFHILELALSANESSTPDKSENQPKKLFTASMKLQEPFDQLLREIKPDCIVTDMFYPWTADIANKLEIPRIVFYAISCFPHCVEHCIRQYAPHEKVNSNSDPFLLPGLPDKIEFKRSKIPDYFKTINEGTLFLNAILDSEMKSYGVFVNSFYELEADYVEYYKKEMKKKVWHIGPVSLRNNNMNKTETFDEQTCLNWLDSKEPNSVLYISFGTLPHIAPEQLFEIAHSLEACDHSFIWVVGKIMKQSNGKLYKDEDLLPAGFEERINKSKRGLIIKKWAPQLLILQHEAVGGFMTHCGWNSILESLNCEVPLITWPITAEQFYHEALVTDVIKVGISVGSVEWLNWLDEPRVTVGREKVKRAINRLMRKEESEVVEMERRVREIAKKAKIAVEEGGSSYVNVDAFIEELKSLRKRN